MTGPARMRHAIAATFLAVFLGAVGFAVWWIQGKLLPRPGGDWSTQHLADPVELIAGESIIRVSRFVLDFERESLTLEQDELSFNDYGDATRTGGKPPLTVPIRLDREATNHFEIVLKNGFSQRLRLVVSPPPANTHRLIILRKSGRLGLDLVPERILELRGSTVVPDELGDRAQPEKFQFSALGFKVSSLNWNAIPRLYGVGVSGSITEGGQLSIDPNTYGFHSDGSIGMTTQVGWIPDPVIFKPTGPDPTGLGRRAFELVSDRTKKHPLAARELAFRDITGQYILVLGPTELSEHRLVIKSEGKVQQVLRLRNRDRDNHSYMLRRLDEAPLDEQVAYRELTMISGYQTIATVWKGHVTSIYRLQGERAKINPILDRFPHLSQVHFMDGETRKLP